MGTSPRSADIVRLVSMFVLLGDKVRLWNLDGAAVMGIVRAVEETCHHAVACWSPE
jgi:hypothetical protein